MSHSISEYFLWGTQMVGHQNTDTEEIQCQPSTARLTREWVQHPWLRVWRRRTDNSRQEPELHSMSHRCLQTWGAKARSRVRAPLSPGAHLLLSHRPPQGPTPYGPRAGFSGLFLQGNLHISPKNFQEAEQPVFRLREKGNPRLLLEIWVSII